jgi:hypothetical protein
MGAFLICSYKPLFISSFSRDLEFSFTEYVDCNLDMPILMQVKGRDMYPFRECKKTLKGKEYNIDACKKVLDFFYRDLLDMCVQVVVHKPDTNIIISVDTNVSWTQFSKRSFSLERAKEEVGYILKNNSLPSGSSIGLSFLNNFTLKQIDSLTPTPLLALIAILSEVEGNTTLEVIK